MSDNDIELEKIFIERVTKVSPVKVNNQGVITGFTKNKGEKCFVVFSKIRE